MRTEQFCHILENNLIVLSGYELKIWAKHRFFCTLLCKPVQETEHIGLARDLKFCEKIERKQHLCVKSLRSHCKYFCCSA